MTQVIQLEGVSFVRGGKSILRDVSWHIEHGQHWALIGANGSGKTTLLKIIAGYEWPTKGRVHVLGREFGHTDIRGLRSVIGWVSNALSERLPGHYTARQIVATGFDGSLRLFREISGEEWLRCDDLLEELNAASVSRQSLDTLSQGEQQRVRIARALVNAPALLILDEPCAGLDPVSRRAFLDDLASFALGASSPTMILVTHHIEEIGNWVSHSIALDAGQVVAAGESGGVLNAEVLSRAFHAECVVRQSEMGWQLELR